MKTGGIQIKKDFTPNVAPSAGYQASIESPDDSRIFSGFPVFWIKTQNNKYAMVRLLFDEDDQPGNELSSIEAWLNPEPGNRILEDKSFQP